MADEDKNLTKQSSKGESDPSKERVAEIVEAVSKNKKADPELVERVVQKAIIASTYSSYQGPLPPPEILRGYEDCLPGSAERIFANFEKQTQHRIGMEKAALSSGIKSQDRGQIMAFVLFLVALVGGFGLAYVGRELAGVAAVIAALAGPLALFFFAKRGGKKELEKKRQEVGAGDPPE